MRDPGKNNNFISRGYGIFMLILNPTELQLSLSLSLSPFPSLSPSLPLLSPLNMAESRPRKTSSDVF